jgi:fructose-specific phosphotransferase system component IIB
MSTNTTTTNKPAELIKAWRDTLPQTLNEGDSVDIQLDQANSTGLYIHFDTAGHSGYSFDFSLHYVDDREVKVELIDVEKSGTHVDEHTEIIQTLIEDYIRHIHECAQILQRVTHD